MLGEEITYKIVVTNDGNLTITDITVKDELTGDEWTIDSLAPEASETFTASYTVTEEDILKGSVKNEATADGDNPSEDPTDPGDDDTEDPTEDPKPSLKVEKTTTSTPADGKAYVLGETIEYEIVVTNDGNLTITDITVKDELTGDEWTIDSLAPEASETFETSYTVTEADIIAGSVVNEATADGENESEEPTDPGDDDTEDPTEEPNPSLSVEKETTSTPANGEKYVLGEEITYKIVVTNDGNLTIKNVEVKDDLTGDKWTIESLEPGAVEEFTTSYTVAEQDVAAGTVKNVATADGDNDSDEPTDPGDDDTEDPVNQTFKLTIYYRYTNGRTAAKTFEQEFKYNEEYSVESPFIKDYNCSRTVVKGTMPAHDVEVTVYYTPTGDEIIEIPTPLGLDNLSLSMGECIE